MTRVRIVEFLLLLVAFGMTTEVFFKLDRAHTVRKEGVFFMRFFDGCVRVDDEEFCNAYTLDDYTRGCDDLEVLG